MHSVRSSNNNRSIRIPSSFNGLYGLRPSIGRVPYAGCVNSLEGQESVLSVLGPISKSLVGVKSFIKSVVSHTPWLKDPMAVRKPWNDAEYNLCDHGEGKTPLCFAILWHDEVVVPHPPVFRALERTKEALIQAGHRGMYCSHLITYPRSDLFLVIDWKPLNHIDIYKNVVRPRISIYFARVHNLTVFLRVRFGRLPRQRTTAL